MERLFCVGLLSLALAGVGQAQEIYKHVAADGTIVYSDQKPSPDAVPMGDELPELTVVQSTLPVQVVGSGDENENVGGRYSDFQLVEPVADQTYRNTAFTLNARTANSRPLLVGHQVRFLVDGQPKGQSGTFSLLLTDVYRGEHQLEAQIVDEGGRVLASSGAVTFHMKQASVNNPGG